VRKKFGFIFLSLFLVLGSGAYAQEISQERQKPIRVYVDIVGDLFHSGHVAFLKKARAFGDFLIVGVLADDVVEEYKREPVLSLEERVKVVEACRYVDQVVVAPPLRLTEEMIKDLEIDYVVHGDDFNPILLEDQYGVSLKLGLFRTVPYTPGISTTQIIERIVQRYDCGEFKKKK
jgi:cytidyltransferase-like protein